MSNAFRIMSLCAVSIAFLMGCSTTHRITQSPRSTVEQLLITEAVIHSLPSKSDESLPIPHGSKVTLNTFGLTKDQTLLQQVITGWLGRQGYLVQKDEKNATYRIDVIVRALGTELSGGFFGLPPIQSTLIPFSLPELALYKSEYQTGYVKFNMNIFEIPTGKFVGTTYTFLADSYHNNYTFLFVFSFTSTDLTYLPRPGSFLREPLNAGDTQLEYETKFVTGK
ncbi:MAG: hypothetical protein E2O81_06240 [Betaproteobacteria bacterium]|nr:MAG: hypothetical protein E2O81_06240 [Betaproteobacteria bacterium]